MLGDYVRLLIKRWRSIFICLLISAAASAAYVSTASRSYSASARLFVSTQGTSDSISNALSGSQFGQDRVTSYADIVNTPAVTAPVISKLGLSTTPSALAANISASAPLNTVLVDVTARSGSAVEAQAIANAVSAQLVIVVDNLESPSGGGTSPVKLSIVKQASLPSAPVSPNKPLDIGLGLLIGLAAGVGLAVLRETVDTTLHSPGELQRIAPGLATLGVIAYDSEAARRPLIVEVSPHSPRAEAFRQLRTNLRFVDPDRPLRSVVITSAVPREGKSTTAANLALTLSRAGVSVLIVEADLRRPRLGRYLNVPDDAAGLSDVLIGHTRLEEALRRYSDDGPFVLGAGSKPPNPSELLGSSAMEELLNQVSKRFDLVLIDAPPLLPVTDAAIIGRIADGVLYVVHAGHTKREQIAQALAALKSVDARVLGVVFNMVGANGSRGITGAYGYNYGYYGYYGEAGPKSHWWSRKETLPERAGPELQQAPLPPIQPADSEAAPVPPGSLGAAEQLAETPSANGPVRSAIVTEEFDDNIARPGGAHRAEQAPDVGI